MMWGGAGDLGARMAAYNAAIAEKARIDALPLATYADECIRKVLKDYLTDYPGATKKGLVEGWLKEKADKALTFEDLLGYIKGIPGGIRPMGALHTEVAVNLRIECERHKGWEGSQLQNLFEEIVVKICWMAAEQYKYFNAKKPVEAREAGVAAPSPYYRVFLASEVGKIVAVSASEPAK